MSLIVFTKGYSNLNLSILFFIAIVGVFYVVNYEHIPERIVGKATVTIIMLPFVVIYLILQIQKIANYPDELLIDIERKTIDIKSKKITLLQTLKFSLP